MTNKLREIEWQFDADDINTVAAWLLAYPSDALLKVKRKGERRQVDIYLDTKDWRMWRAGYGLRVRYSAGHIEATMKSIAAAVDGLRQRVEINETIALATADAEYSTMAHGALVLDAPGDVGARVRRITGKHPLRVLFETHTHRTAYTLTLKNRTVGEVDLDDTTFPGGNADHAVALQRIEIELAGESQDVAELGEFVKQIVKECDLRDAKLSKFEAGLMSRALKPRRIKGADFGKTAIDAHATMADLAWSVLRRNYAAMLAHEPGARLGEVAEEIHLMRVAIRRLRAALSLFRDVLPHRLGLLRAELGWIAGELGAVRDLDVMVEQVTAWGAPADAGAAARDCFTVATVLTATRADEQGRLLAMLDSERYEKLLADFAHLLRKPPAGPGCADAPAREAMPELLAKLYRKTLKLGSKLQPDSPAPDYHQCRIRVKRLRYGLEFMKPLSPKPMKALLVGIAELQDKLGAFQDAQTALHRLRAISNAGQKSLPHATLEAIATVIQRYESHAASCLSHFPKTYRRFKGKKWKHML